MKSFRKSGSKKIAGRTRLRLRLLPTTPEAMVAEVPKKNAWRRRHASGRRSREGFFELQLVGRMAGKVPVAALVGNGVNRVALTVRRTLPVFPYERTSAAPVGMSQRCQKATYWGAMRSVAPSHLFTWTSFRAERPALLA